MAITLSESCQKMVPAITMDHLHLDSFVVKQERGSAKVVQANGCRYGEDAEGNIVYDSESIEAFTRDLDASFVEYVIGKTGQTPEEVVTDIASAKTAICADYKNGNISDAQIIAYAELTISYFFQIMNKLELDGVE